MGSTQNRDETRLYKFKGADYLNPMTPRIQAIVENFISELQAALAEEGSEAIRMALVGGTGAAPKRGPGRPAKVTSAPKARPKGGKRTAEDLEAIKKTIVATIKKTPGLKSDQIASELGTSTKEIQLPMIQLREERAIRMKGTRRAAQYFVK